VVAAAWSGVKPPHEDNCLYSVFLDPNLTAKRAIFVNIFHLSVIFVLFLEPIPSFNKALRVPFSKLRRKSRTFSWESGFMTASVTLLLVVKSWLASLRHHSPVVVIMDAPVFKHALGSAPFSSSFLIVGSLSGPNMTARVRAR